MGAICNLDVKVFCYSVASFSILDEVEGVKLEDERAVPFACGSDCQLCFVLLICTVITVTFAVAVGTYML